MCRRIVIARSVVRLRQVAKVVTNHLNHIVFHLTAVRRAVGHHRLRRACKADTEAQILTNHRVARYDYRYTGCRGKVRYRRGEHFSHIREVAVFIEVKVYHQLRIRAGHVHHRNRNVGRLRYNEQLCI